MDNNGADIPVAARGTDSSPLVARIISYHDNNKVEAHAFAYFASSPGLSRLKWAGKYLPPAIEQLTGIELDNFTPGSATYRMPISDWLQWEEGTVPEGVLGILADTAHTGAVLSTAEPAFAFLTAELSVQFCGRIRTSAARLEASGTVLSADGGHVLSRVDISDSLGNLVGVSTARSSFLPLPNTLPEPPDHSMLSGLNDVESVLQPFRLQAEGQGLPTPVTAGRSGQEFLRSAVSGQCQEPPLQSFIGIGPIAVGEGTCAFGVNANPWLCSHSGSVQGGMVSLIAERAAWGAVLTGLAPGESCRTLDLKVNYFHQMVQGSGTLRAIGEVIHNSRRIAVASVRVEGEDGRLRAYGTATVGVTRARA